MWACSDWTQRSSTSLRTSAGLASSVARQPVLPADLGQRLPRALPVQPEEAVAYLTPHLLPADGLTRQPNMYGPRGAPGGALR